MLDFDQAFFVILVIDYGILMINRSTTKVYYTKNYFNEFNSRSEYVHY